MADAHYAVSITETTAKEAITRSEGCSPISAQTRSGRFSGRAYCLS